MCFRRTAFAIFSALLAGALQTWAASFPRSIVPVARATAAQAVGGQKTYGRIVRTALTADEMAAPADFDISLKLRNREELEARVNRGEILSRAALEAYLPTAADYAKVRAWLVAQGFKITLEADSRHAIFAHGSNAQVAAAFGVQLARVATADGEFTSAVAAPSVPDEIAGVVASIRGLQPHLIRHPRSPRGQQLETNSYYTITPAAVAAVYQTPVNLTGAGQTIAVIGDSVPSTSDLSEFMAECGLPQSMINFSVTNVQGGPGKDVTDQFEMSMDVEWTSGLAPAAQVLLYATPYPMSSDSEAAAYTQILNDLPSNPTIHQVTESYGGIEPPSIQDGDSSLILLIAQGVTCFAASDDGGSNPDPNTGNYNASAPLSVSYPASDPSMTAVGGTTLIFPQSSNGQYAPPEVAWSLSTYQGVTGATGGGISELFSRPSWQAATGVPAGNQRCLPDVSAMAYTGSASDDMGPLVYQGGIAYTGSGTSLSSPIWAGLCALINQSRANASLAPVGFLNPKIYPAAGTSCFTDITSGSNGAYSAGVGYDLCTGLGTPLVGNLITYLSTYTPSPWISSQPTSMVISVGQLAQFSVAAGGDTQPSYQWQVSTDGGNAWTNLTDTSPYSGTATATLTVTGATAATNGDQYRCVVTTTAGSVTSNVVKLTAYGTPVFTIQPVDHTMVPGSTVYFTVAATASGMWSPSYQWQVSTDGGNTWTNLTDTAPSIGTTSNPSFSGTNAATLTITGVTAALNGYQYRCLASNPVQHGVASNAAILTISITVPSGSLWGMGDNSYGDLGDGTTTQRYAPVQILSSGVKAVAAGDDFSLIVKTDGSLWAMGNDDWGQLGDGTVSNGSATDSCYSPEQILPGGVRAVAAGECFSLVLKTDGSLWAMGDNSNGQLGDGTTSNSYSPEQIMPGGVKAVSAGDAHSLIVKTDGSLWVMGRNSWGELGDGSTTDCHSPEEILSGGVQAVAAGGDFGVGVGLGGAFSLIVKTDGSLWAMGNNQFGQLGDGTTTQQSTPERILPGGVQAVAAGSMQSLILKTDGSLWAMGGNLHGLLGDGTPVQILAGGVQAIAAGGSFMILKTDGSLWTVGSNSVDQLIAVNVQQIAAGVAHSLFVIGYGNGAAPAVTIQPISRTVAVGGNASFAVAAVGNPAPMYQWQLAAGAGNTWTNLIDTAPYSGTSTSTLTITGVTTALNGCQYRCLLSNVAGSTTSDTVTLNVDAAPIFTTQPASQTAVGGDRTTFTAAASGNPTPTYQWKVSTDGGNTWATLNDTAPYSGTTTGTLIIAGATPAMNSYQYQCLASNSAQSDVASSTAILTVMPAAVITGVPGSVITTGFTANWNSVNGAVGYRLDVSTENSFSSFLTGYQDLDVGNITSKAISGLNAGTTYYYRVRAYDSAGVGTSFNSATVTTTANIVISTPLTVSTLAGQPMSSGNSDGTGSAARFYYPSGIAADTAGNLYLADTDNHTIRKVVASSGAVTTLAGLAGSSGSTDGTGSAARFNSPSGVAVDGAGNVYVADTLNNTLRRVSAAGAVSTLAGQAGASGSANGTGTAAQFFGPQGLAIDGSSNLYLADTNNHTIRKVVPSTGVVTTVAGLAGNSGGADGPGSLARFNYPSGVAVDRAGDLYVADTDNFTIRTISSSGQVSTLAGLAGNSGGADGTGGIARFDSLSDLAVDSSGNIYVTDTDNFTIRRVVSSTGVVSTLAGLAGSSGSADGLGTAVRFFHPAGIAVDSSSNLYVADTDNHTVRLGLLATAPAIQTQPQSQTVTAGDSVQFSVTASGRPAVTYQWYFGGTAIGGATGSSYSLSNAQSGNAGSYSVVVSNVVGSMTSNAATLTVNVVTQPPNGGGGSSGGGGGGAPSGWFCGALFLLAAVRRFQGRTKISEPATS